MAALPDQSQGAQVWAPGAQNDPRIALLGRHVYRNPNGEGLPHWPLFDQEEQYLQLNLQPAVGRALKAHRFQFWTTALPQKIQELEEPEEIHTEL